MLIKQTLLYLPAQLVGPIFQLVSVIAWTHFLTPERMGVFALVMATQELAYIATMFWFTLYTMRYFDSAATAEDRQRFLQTESMMMAVSTAASVIIVAALVATVETEWTVSLVLAALSCIMTRAIITQLTDRARTAHDTLTYSILQIVWPVVGLAAGILLVAYVEQSAAMVLWGYTIAQVLTLVLAVLRLEIGWRPWQASGDIIKVALRYGLPLLAGGVFTWIASNGLRFLVEFFEGAAAVGLLTVGWALGLRAASFAAMLVTAAAFPLAMRRAREGGMGEGQAQLVRNGVLLLIAMLPASAGLWAIARPLTDLFVAAPFREMTHAILPLAIAAGAIRALRIHFGEQVFLLHERPVVPLVNDIIDAVLSLGGAGIGLWLGGLPGSVAGATAGAGVSLVVTLACGWHWYRYALPFVDAIKVGVATLAMLVAVRQMPLAATLPSITIAVVVGAIVYGVVLAALYPSAAARAFGLLLSGLRLRRAGGA